jgi:Zn-finger nucleic acid-binding protein
MMNCPLCSVELQMSERSGVEIDYCPKCRGVWLDRGELDKIIAISATGRGGQEPYGGKEDVPRRGRERDRTDYDQEYGDEEYGGRRQRRGSWLGDLFDFGD